MGVRIIAEAGVNHNGDIDIAKRMIEAAADAGADYIKFQTFKAEKLVVENAAKAKYQQINTGNSESQFEMLKKLELTQNAFIELKNHCKEKGIGFISTPFDLESIDFLESLDMDFWKVPSGEVTNFPYLVKIARTGRPIVMSTGMCEIEEIREAVLVLLGNGCNNLTLLHCNTMYPTPFEDVNLRAMETLGKEFNVPLGYSDHTIGIEVPIAAVAMGATVIEKHFTLDKNMEGPDHKASLSPGELKRMVSSIRHIERAMGDGVKRVTGSERINRDVARKSIVAAVDIKAGEVFTEENLTVKRPGTGVSPMKWKEVLGRKATQDFKKDDLIVL
ncbi:MAG: N-acetylneuraminate synthase [Lachnospiraceae bacterium]|nr:N-acetylneuraminate synthase [Lachnospiraceae bacterium]